MGNMCGKTSVSEGPKAPSNAKQSSGTVDGSGAKPIAPVDITVAVDTIKAVPTTVAEAPATVGPPYVAF